MATLLSLTPGVHLLTPSSPALSTLIDSIVHLHASCVLIDGTLATFLPPLSHSQLFEWWQKRVDEVRTGERQIIINLSRVAERTATAKEGGDGEDVEIKAPWLEEEGKTWPVIPASSASSADEGLEVSGIVALSTPFSQTGPFRSLVEKLFVHPLHRRRGIARAVLSRLETVAWECGRWNLMLDTTVGSPAENVYPRLGYERLCVIPEYGIHPLDGRFVDEVWFYKDLRRMERLKE